jgi:hypothetical protein
VADAAGAPPRYGLSLHPERLSRPHVPVAVGLPARQLVHPRGDDGHAVDQVAFLAVGVPEGVPAGADVDAVVEQLADGVGGRRRNQQLGPPPPLATTQASASTVSSASRFATFRSARFPYAPSSSGR